MNNDCTGKGNLRWHGYSGHKRLIRGLYCGTCGKYFSERKGTVLEHSRLDEVKAISLLEHLRDGCGVRSTSRLVRVSTNTVLRYSRRAGKHAVAIHDELVAFSAVSHVDLTGLAGNNTHSLVVQM